MQMIPGINIKEVLVTGGCGFIGSHFLSKSCNAFPDINFTNIDNLSYAASINTEKYLTQFKNYNFQKIDISDLVQIKEIFEQRKFDLVVHFAAESHVDNSINSPIVFINTNIVGTYNILQCISESVGEGKDTLFHHISTDEVYGSLDLNEKSFCELSNFSPSSPYSASKASSDLIVEAWGKTFDIKYLITNCSNNFGPRQHTEKLIPKTVNNILNNKYIPVFGNGTNIRDWLYVEDHIDAILSLYKKNLFINERFNIGGGFEISNIEIINEIISILQEYYGQNDTEKLIKFVEDRKGHDFRYSIDNSKIRMATNWSPSKNFKEQLKNTINWYMLNENWWDQ